MPRILIFLLVTGLLAVAIPLLIANLYTRTKTYQPSAAPEAPAAVVFGAGLRRDGSPTPILRDRVFTAVQLYQAGKVKKLLMSGDNRFVNYNEPASMKAYAVSLGVPEGDIILDYAGRRTYDTCYRAKYIFGLDRVLLVTQKYHLARAVFTCNMLGLDGMGISADQHVYSTRSQSIWSLREVPATMVAVWEVWVGHPIPVLGDPEPIFPPGNAN